MSRIVIIVIIKQQQVTRDNLNKHIELVHESIVIVINGNMKLQLWKI